MKKNILLIAIISFGLSLTSCSTEVLTDDDDRDSLSLAELLNSYDLWYVDINETRGNGEVPFMQIAFTLTFDRGDVLANNNLVGFGNTGNGYGIGIGYYDAYGSNLEIDHDVDGVWGFEVIQHSGNKIELYNSYSNTSYFLYGYLKTHFDYDALFYDNIRYFLQEYDAWEKTYTSAYGAINEFDEENFLSFLPDGNDSFLSSIDKQGTPIGSIYWDYEGLYEVYDVSGEKYLKTLTLDYDFMGNDYFELNVIDDETIELFHPNSGTVYEFTGRGLQYYLRSENNSSGSVQKNRKRIKTENPVMNIDRKSEYKKIKIEVN